MDHFRLQICQHIGGNYLEYNQYWAIPSWREVLCVFTDKGRLTSGITVSCSSLSSLEMEFGGLALVCYSPEGLGKPNLEDLECYCLKFLGGDMCMYMLFLHPLNVLGRIYEELALGGRQSPKDMLADFKERSRGKGEKYRSVASYTCPGLGLNPQPRHVP